MALQKEEFIINTSRLGLRELQKNDFEALCVFLQDIQVMYAWEYAFSDEQVREFICSQQQRYQKDGFGYYAAVEKQTGRMIGCIGPLMEHIQGEDFYGLGYILSREAWGKGFATEGAGACMEHLFRAFHAPKVVAEIRPENRASVAVAQRLGMRKEGEFVKIVQGKQMPHAVYVKYANG